MKEEKIVTQRQYFAVFSKLMQDPEGVFISFSNAKNFIKDKLEKNCNYKLRICRVNKLHIDFDSKPINL